MTRPRLVAALALPVLLIPLACSGAEPRETLGAAPLDPRVAQSIDAANSGPDDVGPADEEPEPTTTTEAEPEEPDVAPDAEPLPTSPAGLAQALSEAEAALRRPGVADEDQRELTQAWARRQQVLYRVLAAHLDWEAEVLGGVDPAVLPTVEANWLAQTELLALVRGYGLSSTLPAWRIVPPPPPEELRGYYDEASASSGIPWEILAAIHLVESRMGRIEGLSTAGAVGPMQFIPSTWESCCEGDPTNTRDAILGAATYLVQRGAPGDMDRALRGYNPSEHYVTAVRSYAGVMTADPDAYLAYHAWEVYFLSTAGLIRIPVGYEQNEDVDASAWVADHPEDLLLASLAE